MKIFTKQANNKPTKYTIPLKSWFNIDANEKKDTSTNGAKRKNKYPKETIFKSMFLNYILILSSENSF
jgi:hypothetical protein